MSKIALVTGGNQGLGLALVKGLANRLGPQDVVYLASRSEELGRQAAERMETSNAEVMSPTLHQSKPLRTI